MGILKLLANDGAASDNFGFSVSISEDGLTVIVGAPFDDASRGSAYIYKYINDVWTQQKITATFGEAGDRFGDSVSISGDGLTVIVGAWASLGVRGSAYVYKYINASWSQTQKLTASDGAGSDYFGYSVSISGDGLTAIVGAYRDDDKGSNSGSAYIFNYL